MPLYVGNTAISGIRVGSTTINKAYTGTLPLWELTNVPGPGPDPDPGGTAPIVQAAQFILARMESGSEILEDWTWSGAPAVVGQYNDDLVALFRASNGGYSFPADIPKAIVWLRAYVNAPNPNPNPNPGGTRQVGPGGIPRPSPGPNVTLATGNTTSGLTISQSGTPGNPRIWDGGGFRVGKITINAGVSDVVVQNYICSPNGRYGVEIRPNGCQRVTVQHLKIENVRGPGDLNGITFHGCQDLSILYNDFTDFVVGDPGGSHTDGCQTWNNDPGEASQRVIIQGNKFWGPLLRENKNFTIHQCIMAQGKAATDGGGGGSGDQLNYYIADNIFRADHNQDVKLEDIDNVWITRNKWLGASSRAIEVRSTSSNVRMYSDNDFSQGSYGQVGYSTTPGPGPLTPPWLSS